MSSGIFIVTSMAAPQAPSFSLSQRHYALEIQAV